MHRFFKPGAARGAIATRFLSAIATAVAASAAMPSSALAECAPFVAHSPFDQREIHYVDQGEKGPSVGDKTVGRRGLVDADGKPLAGNHWITHMLEVDDDGVAVRVYQNSVAVFEDGVIFSAGETSYRNPVSALKEKNSYGVDTTVTREIIGGTGAYAGATGTVTVATGDTDVFQFDITCN